MTRSCLIRSLPCEASCWPPLEDLVGGSQPLGGKEGARVAEALALLVLPTADNRAVSEKGESLQHCVSTSNAYEVATPRELTTALQKTNDERCVIAAETNDYPHSTEGCVGEPSEFLATAVTNHDK